MSAILWIARPHLPRQFPYHLGTGIGLLGDVSQFHPAVSKPQSRCEFTLSLSPLAKIQIGQAATMASILL